MKNKTVDMIIRGVTPETRQSLKIIAAQKGKSLQGLILDILIRFIKEIQEGDKE